MLRHNWSNLNIIQNKHEKEKHVRKIETRGSEVDREVPLPTEL